MKYSDLTPKILYDALVEVARKFPDNVNPTQTGDCVYTDNNGNHCWVGQALVDLGLDVPDVGDLYNTQSAAVLLELHGAHRVDVGDIAECAQLAADNWDTKTWAQACDEFRDNNVVLQILEGR